MTNLQIPVSDNVADLKNELLILKDSIRSIMRMIISVASDDEEATYSDGSEEEDEE